MKITLYSVVASLLFSTSLIQAKLKSFKLTDEWSAKIESIAPESALAAPQQKRTVLVFTLMTGFKHWSTPHTAEVVRILGEKTGAFEAVISEDVSLFEADKLKQYDAIVLVNTCPKRSKRNLFFDALNDAKKAALYEDNLINFVKNGKGLVGIHGGIVMLNLSEDFGDAMGGSFDFHPPQQKVICKVLNHSHPVSSAFGGEDMVHIDEPYCFNGCYPEYNFYPLLQMELPEASQKDKARIGDKLIRYIAWIKPYGEGRVFYCSPSHNAQSFENPHLLRFILNGIQYALGDLDCDDTPIGPHTELTPIQ